MGSHIHDVDKSVDLDDLENTVSNPGPWPWTVARDVRLLIAQHRRVTAPRHSAEPFGADDRHVYVKFPHTVRARRDGAGRSGARPVLRKRHRRRGRRGR